ncbi:hypothetical protein HGA88_02085 [Candidatus Roizmanbacteria bacterium]|nr:hypothetical protein [Candidatus Roizmanbacteria bacterium]
MNDLDILEQQAVDAAINQEWEQAVVYNKQILDLESQNVPAFLRLGFAELQRENISAAKEYYTAVLKLQPNNQMALDNLERIAVLSEKGAIVPVKERTKLDPNLFLEITGKTKSVPVVNIGQKNVLARLIVGQEIELKLKARKVEVRTRQDEYIGALPDDVSKRLIFFLKAKSTYRAYIKEANLSKVVIFIQEEKKGKKVAHYSSFPATQIQTAPSGVHGDSDEERADDDGEAESDSEDDFPEEDELSKLASEDLDEEDKELLQLQREEEPEEEE